MGITVKVAGIWSRVLSIILALAILGALGVLGYTIANPRVGAGFSEFLHLGVRW